MKNTKIERNKLFLKATKLLDEIVDLTYDYSDRHNDLFVQSKDCAKYALNEIDEDDRKPQYPLHINEMLSTIKCLEDEIKYVKHLCKIDELINNTPEGGF